MAIIKLHYLLMIFVLYMLSSLPNVSCNQATVMEKSQASSKLDEAVCALKYQKVSLNHTACLKPARAVNEPVVEGISPAVQSYIVRMHNHYRSTVHKYNDQPQAANMQKMYWDDELANLAQKWASNCLWMHDDPLNRNIPGSYPVGQNLALGHRGWSPVIRHWQVEVEHLNFGEGKTSHEPIGHYTQMVWAESARIGCGYARCNRTSSFYVCNYAPTGNYIKNQFTPYKAGPSASSCPNFKKGTLCDCGGKVCKNGGTLDLDTCQCKCINKPWIEQSGDCSLKCEKAEDFFVCASQGGSWNRGHCSKYANVAYEYCPITCGLCSGSDDEQTTPDNFDNIEDLYEFEDEAGDFGETTVSIETDYYKEDAKWDGSVLNNGVQENTTPINIQPTKPHKEIPTTKTTKTTTTTMANIESDLPLCDLDEEPAKCGQPSARGYYNPMYCQYGIAYYCPAMCRKCRVRRCTDYDGNIYQLGESWMNEFGKFTCLPSGVQVVRGCYIEKVQVIIGEGEDYSYMNDNINWRCECSTGYTLSCKGVWSPQRRLRHKL